MKRITELRVKAGLTQKALAAKINVQQPLISEWEQGHKNPTLPSLRKLAKALKISVSELL